MRAVWDKMLNLLRTLTDFLKTHALSMFNGYIEITSMLYILWISLAISQFFVTADSHVRLYPNAQETHTLIQMKYAILMGYSLFGLFIGIILRWCFVGRKRKSKGWKCWLDIGKAGIIVGGLASAKLAGITTIVRELTADMDAIASEWVVYMAMIPIIVIVLVAYITARESVRKA